MRVGRRQGEGGERTDAGLFDDCAVAGGDTTTE